MQYLRSLPIMVALEPDEPLLLYVVATADVISMVLVAEWPEPLRPTPRQPQVLKGAPAAGSGSQDLDPAKGPRDQEAFGSQIPESTLSLEP
jgi:hypothetical protein